MDEQAIKLLFQDFAKISTFFSIIEEYWNGTHICLVYTDLTKKVGILEWWDADLDELFLLFDNDSDPVIYKLSDPDCIKSIKTKLEDYVDTR